MTCSHKLYRSGTPAAACASFVAFLHSCTPKYIADNGIANLTELPTTATTSSNAGDLHDVSFWGSGDRSAANPATTHPERHTCSLARKLTGHQMGPSCACPKEQLAGGLCPQPHPSERLSSSLPIIEWRGGPEGGPRPRTPGARSVLASLVRPQPGTYVGTRLAVGCLQQ
jgi:hypothetical protein